jgi:hypothetical protein
MSGKRDLFENLQSWASSPKTIILIIIIGGLAHISIKDENLGDKTNKYSVGFTTIENFLTNKPKISLRE